MPLGTMRKIKVSGDDYEMGFQYGREMRELINRMVESLPEMGMIKVMRPKIVPKTWFLKTLRKDTEKLMKDDILKHYPRQGERLKGIADGAKVDPSTIILMISLEASGFSLGGCTSLAFPSNRVVENEPVLARNFDFPIEFTEFQAVVESLPKDGYGTLGCSIVPSPGVLDGLNEHGLAAACNFAYSMDRPTCIVPLSLTLQEMLENCKNVDEAVKYLVGCERGGYGAIVTLVDADSNIKVVELSPHSYCVREVDDVAIATNHYSTEKMRKIELPREALYSRKAPKELWGKRVYESSERRYGRAEELIKVDRLREEEVVSILRDHGVEGQPSELTICRHIPYHNTIRSTLIYLKRRMLKVAAGNPCKVEYQQFTLQK